MVIRVLLKEFFGIITMAFNTCIIHIWTFLTVTSKTELATTIYEVIIIRVLALLWENRTMCWLVSSNLLCLSQRRELHSKAPAKRSQHVNATYRNIVGHNMLCAFGHPVATCCGMFGVVGSRLKMVKFEPTTPNMSQQGGQMQTKCCAQQCCDMLGWHAAIVWPKLKPRPNDRNMPTQDIATLLGATCCVRLATLLRLVATCWVLLAQIWPFSNLSQQHPTWGFKWQNPN